MSAAKLSLEKAWQPYRVIANKKRSGVQFQQHQEVIFSTNKLSIKTIAKSSWHLGGLGSFAF
jgi:hypothetical protein